MSARPARPETAAREAALQMIYALDLGGQSLATVERWYLQAHPLPAPAATSALALLAAAVEHNREIEALIARHAIGWRVERLSAVDRSLLKLATAELLLHPALPARAVIQAAVRMARKFSQPEAEAFVRGVLEAVVRERTAEPEAVSRAR